MTRSSPYASIVAFAMRQAGELNATPKRTLTLIATRSTTSKAAMPTPTPPRTKEEMKLDMARMIRENAIPTSPPRRIRPPRNSAAMSLADHVHLVRNSLDAVCALTQSTQPQGEYENGELDTLANLGRDNLGALLELISDRLGTALELDGG